VVDYLGIARELKLALATYTESGGKGRTALPQEEAVSVMLEKYEICRGLFHGFDWTAWVSGTSEEIGVPNGAPKSFDSDRRETCVDNQRMP
jgi:type I restriction enzyme, R subunit